MSALRLWPALAALALSACAVGPKYLAQDFIPPARAAVLPFTNETNDVEAPDLVRKAFEELVSRRGYAIADPATVNAVLRDQFDITQGGQLNSAEIQKLGQALSVDALFYGNVISFVDLPLGLGRKRTVKAEFRLVDAKTEQLLWEDSRGWTTPDFYRTAEEARIGTLEAVVDRQKRRMNGTFLREETLAAVRMALETLPAAGPLEEKR